MAVVYTDTMKTARLQVVIDAIDAGAGAGTLEIGTTGMASILATFTLADPSATITTDVLTFSGTPIGPVTAGNTGTAAEARIRDSDANDVVTALTVGTSGTDVIIDNTSITSGQEVTFNSGTITHG